MNAKSYTALASLFLILLVGPAFASASELLYVQEGHNLITYSINSTSAAPTKISTLYMNASPTYPIQIFHAPTSPFLYILGFTSATRENFWVHALASNGAPTENPIQVLAVKPALTQFLIHPNGNFGYAEYSWTASSSSCNGVAYYADIVLYTINTKTGKLTNTTKPVANFGANCSLVTYLFGGNTTGTKLYTDTYPAQASYGDASFTYYYSTIDPSTGLLGKQVQFWTDLVSPDGERSAINDKLIAQSYQGASNAIRVYRNAVYPKTPVINCTSSMLQVCGDLIAAGDTTDGLYFDPSGKYLFTLDLSTNTTPILKLNLAEHTLENTGSSLPGNSPVLFSRDGTVVYTLTGDTININLFNPATGELGASSSITVQTNPNLYHSGVQIFPW